MATPLDDARSQRVSALHPRLIEAARVDVPVWLETEEAQRLLQRRFEPYQHSAYFLFFIAREHMPPKLVASAERYLRQCLEITMKEINEGIDEVSAWVDARKIEPRRKEHLPPLRVNVGACTSLSRRYLEVIAQLDNALGWLHAIGRIDHKNRGQWKRRAEYLTRSVRNIAVDARREIGRLKSNHPDLADQDDDDEFDAGGLG